MRVVEELVDVAVSFGVVRTLLMRPVLPPHRRVPLLCCFPDIFGNTPSHARVMRRLASHGFLVMSPEPWAHHLPPGTVLDFDADRDRALACQDSANVDVVDEVRRANIAHGRADAACNGHVCAMGFCYGGHLAFRAATDASCSITATACFYATGLHQHRLGNTTATTLLDAANIRGDLLLVWGRDDPHIPAAGRALIHRTLDDAAVRFETRLYDAEHAFGRDVGTRYDAAAFDDAITASLALMARTTSAVSASTPSPNTARY